jgi:hypothetical protein
MTPVWVEMKSSGSPWGWSVPPVWSSRSKKAMSVVYAADVCRPGFDAFLEDVRAHVADRETTQPSAIADGGRDPGCSEITVTQRGRRC